MTLGAVVPRYLAYAVRRQKAGHHGDTKRYLEKNWSPLAELSLNQITRATVSQLLAAIATGNGPFAANRARAALSAFYGWAMSEGIAAANPVIGTHKATEEVRRDRVLTNAELVEIWQHAGQGGFGSIVRLLILTGQRREEVGGILRPELHGDLWRIAGERTKNGLDHDVPLLPAALAILTAVPHREERQHVFGAGSGPFQGWSKSKENLDARIVAARKERLANRVDVEPWRLHDIRRTVATRMADLWVLPHVVEAVLNHISGHKAGVAGIYNRSSYAAEKRAALDLWGAHVAGLMSAQVR